MSRQCCLRTCRELAGQSLLRGERPPRTFKFPNDNLRARWNLFVNQANRTTDFKASSHSLCARHFNPSCFSSTGGLLPNSIPTLADGYTLEAAQKYKVVYALRTTDLKVINDFSNTVVQLRGSELQGPMHPLPNDQETALPRLNFPLNALQIKAELVDLDATEAAESQMYKIDTVDPMDVMSSSMIDPMDVVSTSMLDPMEVVSTSIIDPQQCKIESVDVQQHEEDTVYQLDLDTIAFDPLQLDSESCEQVTNTAIPMQQSTLVAKIALPVQQDLKAVSIKTPVRDQNSKSQDIFSTLQKTSNNVMPAEQTDDKTRIPYFNKHKVDEAACVNPNMLPSVSDASLDGSNPGLGMNVCAQEASEFGSAAQKFLEDWIKWPDQTSRAEAMQTKLLQNRLTPKDLVNPVVGKRYLDLVQKKLSSYRRRIRTADQKYRRVEARLKFLEKTLVKLKEDNLISEEVSNFLKVNRIQGAGSVPKRSYKKKMPNSSLEEEKSKKEKVQDSSEDEESAEDSED